MDGSESDPGERRPTIGFVTHETPERSFADPAITGAHDVADEFGSRLRAGHHRALSRPLAGRP